MIYSNLNPVYFSKEIENISNFQTVSQKFVILR